MDFLPDYLAMLAHLPDCCIQVRFTEDVVEMDLDRLLPGQPAEDMNRVLAPYHPVPCLGENLLEGVFTCELDEEMTSDGMLKSARQFLQVKASILLEKVPSFRDRHSTLSRIGASDVPTDCPLQADEGVGHRWCCHLDLSWNLITQPLFRQLDGDG